MGVVQVRIILEAPFCHYFCLQFKHRKTPADSFRNQLKSENPPCNQPGMTRDSIRFVDDHSKVELLGQNVEREQVYVILPFVGNRDIDRPYLWFGKFVEVLHW